MSKYLNPRIDEYEDYLIQHIHNVIRSWNELLKPVVEKFYPEEILEVDRNIYLHDQSKYDDEEFIPYLNYFYPSEGFESTEEEFDYAWLRHQKMNPHHWQYWVLLKDSGELQIMDIPFEYICEMLCDWHSFSAKDPTSTAYNWFKENKEKMKFSNFTLEMITFLIEYLKQPLVPQQ